MEKMLHYFHNIFSQFRSSFFSYLHSTNQKLELHHECLLFLLKTIASDCNVSKSEVLEDAISIHWRNRLLVGWFLLSYVEKNDLTLNEGNQCQIWHTCFDLVKTEVGQPLQRVAL